MREWSEFLDQQDELLGVATTNRWLRSLVILRYDAANLYLEATDSFQEHWFEEHIRPLVKKSLKNANGRPIRVHLSTRKKEPSSLPLEVKSGSSPLSSDHAPLNPLFQWDNFIFTEQNELLKKVLLALLEKDPENHFNPIFIYGPSGSGKTHLLSAIANYYQTKGLIACYAHADTFTKQLVQAIRSGQMQQFRAIYRKSDLLLIDDVSLLARKFATQEEFFHTFNALHLSEKPIILSSPVSPQQLQHIEPRLISRFEWGISLRLTPLSSDFLPTLVEKRARDLSTSLPQPTIEFLVAKFKSSPKALMGAVETLILRSHLQQPHHHDEEVSPEYAKKLLKELLHEEDSSQITMEKIVNQVAQTWDLRLEDLLGDGKSRDVAIPRQMAMFLARELLKLPYQTIASFFHRDHSTVIVSIRKIALAIQNSSHELHFHYQNLLQKLTARTTV